MIHYWDDYLLRTAACEGNISSEEGYLDIVKFLYYQSTLHIPDIITITGSV